MFKCSSAPSWILHVFSWKIKEPESKKGREKKNDEKYDSNTKLTNLHMQRRKMIDHLLYYRWTFQKSSWIEIIFLCLWNDFHPYTFAFDTKMLALIINQSAYDQNFLVLETRNNFSEQIKTCLFLKLHQHFNQQKQIIG